MAFRKRILLAMLFSFCFNFSKAQFVTIPDTNFVNWLNVNGYSSCLLGNQIDTTCSAVVNTTSVNLSFNNISDLTGITYFDSLKYLACKSCILTSLPALPSQLKHLDVRDNNISLLPVLPNNLDTLICTINNLVTLPNLPNQLSFLHCGLNNITLLPTLPNSLRYLNCQQNLLNSLPILPIGLKNLECQQNQLQSLPILNDSLEYLNSSGNLLAAIPFLPLQLKHLDCAYNTISTLPSLPTGIVSLYCLENQLTSLPVLPDSLLTLHCRKNLLTTLPSIPSKLEYLNCSNNQIIGLPFLPQKINSLICDNNQLSFIINFTDSLSYLDISNNSNLICLPPFKNSYLSTFYWYNTGISCFPNEIISFNANPTIINVPVCDPFNINNCPVYWNIRGSIYSDSISNCILDSVEPVHPKVKIRLYKNSFLEQQTYSNQSGLYSFDTDTGNYVVEVDTIDNSYTIDCPPLASYQNQVALPNLFFDNNDFSLSCGAGFDVGVNSIYTDSGIVRPGNLARIKLVAGDLSNFSNLNCATGISGNVKVLISGPASFNSVIPGSITPSFYLDSLLYTIPDFGLVNAFNDFRFIIEVDTAAQLGQQVCVSVLVNPYAGDVNVYNNYYSHCFTVVNSYDPNDKQVSPSGLTDTSLYDLTYTIRFQNTGNAPAQHVYVLDTLDQNIDESSFQLLAYSHEPQMQIIGKRVRFNFPNINLPDSVNNEPMSHGFVQYRVRRKESLPIGTQIHNTAYIYFDFNAPVQTNTTINEIAVSSGVGVGESQNPILFSIFPNPLTSAQLLNIYFNSSEKKKAELSVYDLSGRKLFTQFVNASEQSQVVALPNISPGGYLVVLNDGKHQAQQKLVVLK